MAVGKGTNGSEGTFVIFIFHRNCSNHSDHRLENDGLLLALNCVQFVCHLLSFFLAMVAFFVVKYYTIAGRRMNHMLLLLTVMEIVYNASSVGNHLIILVPPSNLRVNIYLLILFSLLGNQCFILTRNWWTALIAIARFLVVSKPLGECHLSVLNCNVYFAVILVVGLIYCIAFTFWFRIFAFICGESEPSFSLYIWDFHDSSPSFQVADALTVCLKSLLPLFLVVIFSLLTYNLVRRPSILQKGSWKNSLRTSRTLLLICFLFAVCQLPYAMTIIFCFLEKDSVMYLYSIVKRVSLILVAINSLGNVAIYFIRSKDFRTALSDMRQCKCNFVELRKITKRQRVLSSWNSYSQSKDKADESSHPLEAEL